MGRFALLRNGATFARVLLLSPSSGPMCAQMLPISVRSECARAVLRAGASVGCARCEAAACGPQPARTTARGSSSTISASHAGRKAIRAVGRLGARFAAPVGFVGAATVVVAVVATALFVR